MERPTNSEGIPLDEIFNKSEINRLRFEKWLLEHHPEDHIIPEENKDEWQEFRRGELMHRLGRRGTIVKKS